MALGQHHHSRMPSWYTAPMQYLDSRGETYCARHKNKCNQACPYRMPLQRRTPIPLNRMLVGTGWPGFGYNYGMFGIDEEKNMGLSGPHHHGHRRGGSFRYNTYMPYPWWYSPMQYAYEEEEVWDASKSQWVRRPVRRTVPITDNPPEGEKYGIFGAGADAEESVGMAGEYGILSRRRRPYGSLSRRYRGNTGVLGATPAPAPASVSPLRTERAAKCMLVGIGIVAGLLLLADDSYTRTAKKIARSPRMSSLLDEASQDLKAAQGLRTQE
jgi:hypothetical protein